MTKTASHYHTISDSEGTAIIADGLRGHFNSFHEVNEFLHNGLSKSDRHGQGITWPSSLNGTPVFMKVYQRRSWYYRIVDALVHHRAYNEWKNHCEAIDRGVPAVEVLLTARWKNNPQYVDAIVTSCAPGKSVRDSLRADSSEQRRAVARHLGRVVAHIHHRGVYHKHLNTGHVFIPADLSGYALIDLEDASFRDELPARLKEKNLDSSIRRLARYSDPLVAEFLDGYENAKCGAEELPDFSNVAS